MVCVQLNICYITHELKFKNIKSFEFRLLFTLSFCSLNLKKRVTLFCVNSQFDVEISQFPDQICFFQRSIDVLQILMRLQLCYVTGTVHTLSFKLLIVHTIRWIISFHGYMINMTITIDPRYSYNDIYFGTSYVLDQLQ